MSPVESRDIELGIIPPSDDVLESSSAPLEERNQNFCGRIVKDWTQVVGGFLTLAGLVGGGVGVGLEDYRVMLGASVVILASSVLLCARISCLKPEKELERQVAYFSGEVDRLTRNEAELKTSRDELRKVLGEAETSIQELALAMKVPVDEIEGLSGKFEAIEEKLHVLIDLYHRYKAVAKAFKDDLAIFRKSQKIADENLSRLGEETKKISSFEEELEEYQKAKEFHRQKNEELQEILSSFQEDFVDVQKRFLLMRGELEELKQHVLKLDEVDDKFSSGGADFEEGIGQARSELLPKLKEIVERLDKAVKELGDD